MSTITVGIAGIMGKFARCVLGHLLKNRRVNIRGYCRDPSKLPAALLSSPRIRITQGQSDDQNALRTFARGSDVIICCYLGDDNLMENGQKSLVDACEVEGVSRYISSDYSLDFTKLELGQLPAKEPMKQVQEYLNGKTVQGVHVLIGIFMETFFTSFFGVWNAKDTYFSYWGSGKKMWESTTYDNAAQFIAAVIQDSSAVGMQRFLRQISEAYEQQYSRKPSLNRLGSLDKLYTHMQQVRKNDPSNYMG